MTPKKKAIIVCTWDWYYYSHRSSIAKMLIDADYAVILVIRLFKRQKEIEADGVRIIDLPFSCPTTIVRSLPMLWRP